MPVLQQLYTANLLKDGVDVIGVTIRTTPDQARQFNERLDIDFSSIYDEGGVVATSYGISGVPTYVFLDRESRVAFHSAGARGMEPIKQYLSRLADEP